MSQGEDDNIWLKTKRYVRSEWDPKPVLALEHHVPVGVWPERLPPKWVHVDGENEGKPFAASQLVLPEQWGKALESMNLWKPNVKDFWIEFARNVMNREIPSFMSPEDPDGPSQLQKLVEFSEARSSAATTNPLLESLPSILPTRDCKAYRAMYSGPYVKRTAEETVYEPAINDSVFVKVDPEGVNAYNPSAVPEPGLVIAVDLPNKRVQVGL